MPFALLQLANQDLWLKEKLSERYLNLPTESYGLKYLTSGCPLIEYLGLSFTKCCWNITDK